MVGLYPGHLLADAMIQKNKLNTPIPDFMKPRKILARHKKSTLHSKTMKAKIL